MKYCNSIKNMYLRNFYYTGISIIPYNNDLIVHINIFRDVFIRDCIPYQMAHRL